MQFISVVLYCVVCYGQINILLRTVRISVVGTPLSKVVRQLVRELCNEYLTSVFIRAVRQSELYNICARYYENINKMSASDINAVIDQLSHASVDGAATLSFAGRGLKLDSESDGTVKIQ